MDTNALYLKGFALEQLGFNTEAIETYNRAIKAFPDNINAHINRTYVLIKEGKTTNIDNYLKIIASINDIGLYDLFRTGV